VAKSIMSFKKHRLALHVGFEFLRMSYEQNITFFVQDAE